jgi:hypothetical protein
VRLGRAANDNGRLPSLQGRLVLICVAIAAVAMAAGEWILR